MSLTQSLLTALFCMTVVFTVLVGLWAIIRLFSVFVQKIEAKDAQKTAAAADQIPG